MNSITKKLQKLIYPSLYFFHANPKRSVIIVIALLFSGLAEAFSFAALLPLINVAVKGEIETSSKLGLYISRIFEFVHLQPSLGIILASIVLLMILKSLLMFFAMKESGYASAEIAADLRSQMVQLLSGAEWSYFVRQKKGILSAAIGTEPDRAATIFVLTGRLIATLIQITVYSVIAFGISVKVTLGSFVVGGLIMLLFRGLIKTARSAGEKQTINQKSLLANLIDGLTGMKPLKAMSMEYKLEQYLRNDIDLLCKARKQGVLSKVLMGYLQEPLQIVPISVGLYFLLKYWINDLESFLVLILLFYRTLQRISILQNEFQDIISVSPSFWFVSEIMNNVKDKQEKIIEGVIPTFKNSIKLKEVTFSHDVKPVLTSVSMEIPKGHIIALVGGSGSGKTTIADLIIGLYRPGSGKILIDDVDLSTIELTQWRKQIGYVPQETFLFNDTIKQNVTLGDDMITDDQVSNALEKAGAAGFVKQLEKGIFTIVGEQGFLLSGGQRQRIALARALVRQPSLLILDESTTSLDPITEREIVLTLANLKKKVTILAVSHQPAIKSIADTVYELNKGKISTASSISYN